MYSQLLSGDGRTEDDKDLWLPADLVSRLPQEIWPRYLAVPAARARTLDGLASTLAVLTREERP
jgi:hypothetical protein